MIGTSLLARVGNLPRTDWRVGVSFFLSAALQTVALINARRHFRASGSVPSQIPAMEQKS